MSSQSKQAVWTREQIKQLIEAVEARECLWNVKSTWYHNQTKRRAAISEISSELNMPDEDIKRKIHTLRAQYSKGRSKMKSFKSGCGADGTYKTKWEFYNMLRFMFCHNDRNVTTDSMDNKIDIHDAATSSVDGINESVSDGNSIFDNRPTSVQSTSTSVIQHIIEEAPAKQTPSSNSRQNIKRKKLTTSEAEEKEAMNRCLSVISQAKPRDEWCTFGENVGNELRSLETAPDLQLKLKNAIPKSILDISCEYAARRFPQPSTPSHTPSTSSASFDIEQGASEATLQLDQSDQPLQASLGYSEEQGLSYFITIGSALSSSLDA